MKRGETVSNEARRQGAASAVPERPKDMSQSSERETVVTSIPFDALDNIPLRRKLSEVLERDIDDSEFNNLILNLNELHVAFNTGSVPIGSCEVHIDEQGGMTILKENN